MTDVIRQLFAYFSYRGSYQLMEHVCVFKQHFTMLQGLEHVREIFIVTEIQRLIKFQGRVGLLT